MSTSLYSCFIVEQPWPNGRLDIFNYGRGHPISGSQIVATSIHTNVPRNCDNGLPMGWAMQVDRWRASTNLRFLVDPVLEWAAETELRLIYNAMPIQITPLVDILMAPQPLLDPRDEQHRVERLQRGNADTIPPSPLVFRENLSFRVEVQRPSEALERHLVNWIVENTIDLKQDSGERSRPARMILWIWLEGVLVRGPY